VSGIHPTAAAGFSAAAEVYERARPGYPDEAVAWLAERLAIGPGRDVLDLAAGTGKLTRQLVPLGAGIIAVEPIDAMRAQLDRAVPSVEALAGTAEAIPLPNGSVDAVVCAQAFHWFVPREALREIHRVLRAGTALGLIWNGRDASDPLQERIEGMVAPHRQAFPGGEGRWRQELDASDLFGPIEHRTWSYKQELTRLGFVERFASTSFVAAMSDDAREALLDEVRLLVDDLVEPIVIPYETKVFVSARSA
jgi:SAM-dependent methyltransferase